MYKKLVNFVQDTYKTKDFIPLHAPVFTGNERDYVNDTLDSTFVSSVGKYVDDFESRIETLTGAPRAIATVNGTSALHVALYLAGVTPGDIVITQALTFVATCNVIHHLGAEPLFVDVSETSLGLCPVALSSYLDENASLNAAGECVHNGTEQIIRSVVPMHTFGHPVEIDEIVGICIKWNITLIEDSAESLGSYYKGGHTGTFGKFGVISFNGNKIITTGGGGVVLCADSELGAWAKHVTTTAKAPHPFEFYHDEPGFNFRMPNLNAALGCAQLEVLPKFLKKKRELAFSYERFFADSDYRFVSEPEYATSNYWLNAVICPSLKARNELLEKTNASGVMTRPVWQLMNRLPMYRKARTGSLIVSEQLERSLVNLPSSVVSMTGETDA
ncbi:aminotransferase DegT [Gammaproteobacteria bacterium 45_16_T64]|nr:aminotransferase DegT [Gammaproteobacteria bacterium 45_16_T64]